MLEMNKTFMRHSFLRAVLLSIGPDYIGPRPAQPVIFAMLIRPARFLLDRVGKSVTVAWCNF
jgi:hypothetical protein